MALQSATTSPHIEPKTRRCGCELGSDPNDHDPHASRNVEVDLVYPPQPLILNKSLKETMNEILSSPWDALRHLLRQEIELEAEYSYHDKTAWTTKCFAVSLKINDLGLPNAKPKAFEEGYECRGAYDPNRMRREMWIESKTQNTEETIMTALMDLTLKEVAERLEREDNDYWAAQLRDDKGDYVKPEEAAWEMEVLTEEDIYHA